MSIKPEESSETRALLYGLENKLHGLIMREHAEIRDELSQMGSVVSDAIKTLMQSLNGLNTQLQKQGKIVQEMASATDAEENEKQHQDYQALGQMVNQNITVVVRSLQFEDIVQQLIGHCRARSEGLEQLVDQLSQDVNILKNASQGDSIQVLSAMQLKIAEVGKKLEKENPVKQTSMGAGGIELF